MQLGADMHLVQLERDGRRRIGRELFGVVADLGDLAARDYPGQVIPGEIGDLLVQDHPAVTQHRDPVGQSDHFLQPVGYVNHADPATGQRAYQFEQVLNLLVR